MGREADPEVLRQSKGRSMGGTMEEERVEGSLVGGFGWTSWKERLGWECHRG